MEDLGRRSILVVDDEALIRNNLADFFHDEGWRVFEADNAERAIAILTDHPSIRVVLTDVRMPGRMDGVKLAFYVRDRYPPTILIVASGAAKLTAAELPERTMFVAKPFDPRSLLVEMEKLG